MNRSRAGTTPGVPQGDIRSPWRWLLLTLTLAPVLGFTLVPSGAESVVTSFIWCLICGEFGTANLVRNVVLFVPLGVALGVLLGPGRWALLCVLAVTATIETLQFHVPGRNPMVVDIAANFAGGALGVMILRWLPWWVAPPRARSAWISLGFAGVTTGVLAGTAWIFTVDLPETEYWGQWTPRLGHLDWYDGRVFSASVGGIATRSWRLEEPGEVRSAILEGHPIMVRAEAGSPPGALAPIFSVYDRERREILLVGAQGEDLVGRVRYRAHRLRFDRPDLRIPGAFQGVDVGDTITLELQVAGGDTCLGLNDRRECMLGPGLERGWSLLRYVEGPPEWFRRILDFVWLLGLFLPFGYFIRVHSASVAGGLVLLGALTAGWWAPSISYPSLLAFTAAGAGLAAGHLLSRLQARRWPGGKDHRSC